LQERRSLFAILLRQSVKVFRRFAGLRLRLCSDTSYVGHPDLLPRLDGADAPNSDGSSVEFRVRRPDFGRADDDLRRLSEIVALKAKSLLASFCRSPVYRASALCDVGTACRSARVPFFLSLALGLELLQFFKGLFVRTLKVRFIVDRASQLLTKPRLLARLGLLVFVLECLASLNRERAACWIAMLSRTPTGAYSFQSSPTRPLSKRPSSESAATTFEKMPCLRAFRELFRLPCCVLGPVE